MKRNWIYLVAIIVALSFTVPVHAAPKQGKKIKIGVSLPTQRDERWVRDAQKMKDVAKEEGVDLHILAPHDATSAAAIVDNAKAAGLKVISYDRLVLDSDVDLYVSFDNFEVGRLMGEYLVNRVPKGNYAVFAGAPTDNNAKLYRDGALSMIKPLVDKGDIKIVMDQWITDWQPTVAMNLMQNALTASNNKIDAIVAPNDNTAGGIIQALEQVGLAGKVPITGQDAEDTAAQRILKGTQTMTVFKDTKEQSADAIHAAIKMVKGLDVGATSKVNNRKKDVPSILLKPIVVDKSNIDEVLIKSGFIKIKE
jgi:D-xylose transport system substrate-binding protein